MRIVYAGTPEFAVQPLKRIFESGVGEVVGVVTQADKPQGRKGILTPPPVKRYAQSVGLPVLQPYKLREETSALAALRGDLLVTCAYGQILPQSVLDLFSEGVWNVHAGLLPAYRGASPVQSCLVNGETETGVCVMKTELGLDTGAVLLCEKTPVGKTETYGELSARLSELGAKLIVQALGMISAGNYTLEAQSAEGVRVTRKIVKENAKIDFSLPAKRIVDLVRGMNPEPVAYTAADGTRLNVWLAERAPLPPGSERSAAGEVLSDRPGTGLVVRCGDGAVKLLEVQAAGGKRMKGSDFLNGKKLKKGQILSC